MLPFQWLGEMTNIHPLFVHFPIALLFCAGALFVAGYYFNKKDLLLVSKWNLILGAVASVVTVGTGFMAEDTLPHNEEIHAVMEMHEPIMVTVAILASILSVYLYRQKNLEKVNRVGLFIAALVVMMILISVGADYGGMMVYKYGASTQLFNKVNSPDSQHSNSHG